MTRSVHASSSKPRRARTQITVEKMAEAAALSKTHSKQFGYLAALARTAQTYLATGEKRQADFTNGRSLRGARIAHRASPVKHSH
ncbi:hypothetical protein B0G81_4487 [Paraburkholderia sp. BL6665CI2N2]|nr:hypothetical protein B0G81_4487 [Paraburkholderia sp. BL6665CI2N2]